MSHTAYFQRLVGKTVKAIKAIEHKTPTHAREMIAILFEDDTCLEVWSWSAFTLDAKIWPEK